MLPGFIEWLDPDCERLKEEGSDERVEARAMPCRVLVSAIMKFPRSEGFSIT